jgi:hypothetical protein
VTLYEDRVDGLDRASNSDLVLWQGRLAATREGRALQPIEHRAETPRRTFPAGTRYELDAAWQPWLQPSDSGCLRMGEAALELVGCRSRVRPEAGSADRTRARRDGETPAAARQGRVDRQVSGGAFPEVDAVRRGGGLPLVARFLWSERETEGKWRLSRLEAARPEPVARQASRAAAAVVAASPQDPAIKPAEGRRLARRGSVKGRRRDLRT